MFEIIPAIMPKDFADLQEKVDLVYKHVKTIHVDVMNGTVTHHVNWPFSPEMEEEFHEITAGKKALPHWKEVDFEVDVMMQDPEDSLAEWVNAGFHRIVVHVESTKKFQKILNEWKGVVKSVQPSVRIQMFVNSSNQSVTAPILCSSWGSLKLVFREVLLRKL